MRASEYTPLGVAPLDSSCGLEAFPLPTGLVNFRPPPGLEHPAWALHHKVAHKGSADACDAAESEDTSAGSDDGSDSWSITRRSSGSESSVADLAEHRLLVELSSILAPAMPHVACQAPTRTPLRAKAAPFVPAPSNGVKRAPTTRVALKNRKL
jgi:hypothetical protein